MRKPRRSKRVCAHMLGEGLGRSRFHTTSSCIPSHHAALSSPCPAWAGRVPNFPQQETKEAQVVHLPRHIPVGLVNNGGGSGPWHKDVVFSWGSRGGKSPRSPAVTGGWGRQLSLSRELHRFTSGIRLSWKAAFFPWPPSFSAPSWPCLDSSASGAGARGSP